MGHAASPNSVGPHRPYRGTLRTGSWRREISIAAYITWIVFQSNLLKSSPAHVPIQALIWQLVHLRSLALLTWTSMILRPLLSGYWGVSLLNRTTSGRLKTLFHFTFIYLLFSDFVCSVTPCLRSAYVWFLILLYLSYFLQDTLYIYAMSHQESVEFFGTDAISNGGTSCLSTESNLGQRPIHRVVNLKRGVHGPLAHITLLFFIEWQEYLHGGLSL